MTLAVQTCAYHPERVGHALCMRCRRVVCQECALTWEGVNHCRPCLEARRAERGHTSPWARWLGWAVLTAALFTATGAALAWSISLWARLF